jgi:predicted transcriptional regulator of viral defense system
MREATRQLIVARVTGFFEIQQLREVYSRSHLIDVFSQNREDWRLRHFKGFDRTVRFLAENTPFRQFHLHSERYGDKFKYAWGECSPYSLGLSLRSESYFSHATAGHLHGLIKDVPEAFFVNAEQSVKPPGAAPTQESIDRAFRNLQRRSSYVLTCNDWRFILLNGKNSGRLGVAKIQQDSEEIAVTDLERTLIDLAVRPSYAGGARVVLEAFKEARDRVSVDKLFEYLQKLGHSYPYHQAIGFYLKHAGYATEQTHKLKQLGLNYNFYLTHAMKESKFDPDWKVSYPAGLL